MHGEITFAITDDGCIKVEFDEQIIPTKVIQKGDIIALGRKAPKSKWMYKIGFNDKDELVERLEKMITILYNHKEYIEFLKKNYEEVGVTLYIRSDYAQVGFSLPPNIVKKLSLLECSIHFDILSFGMVNN